MRFTAPAFVIVCAASWLTFGAADFFPIDMGTWWMFSYVKEGGGLGVSGRDEGIIKWTVVSKDVCRGINCYGPQYCIEQRRFITKSTSREPGTGAAMETPYDPPRLLSVDSLFLEPWSTGNALSTRIGGYQYPKTQCAFFIHDTGNVVPSDSVMIVKTSAKGPGTMIDAIKVIPLVCPFGCPPGRWGDSLRYFTLADGIGPVAYRERNTPCVFDAYYTETWTLTSHSAATGVVRRAVNPAGFASGVPARTYALNGATLDRTPGNRLDVRSAAHGGTRTTRIVVTVDRQGIAKLEHGSKGN